MTHYVIVLPELLTVPEATAVDVKLPALEHLLSRSQLSTIKDRCVEQSLMRHFGYSMPDQFSLPAGKIRWAADFDTPMPQYCVCADPVHMLADIDHARLMDAKSLKLSNAESEHYIAALNKMFEEDGLTFVSRHPDRWYLTGMDAAMLKTLPVKTLVGRNVASFLPEGDASAHWRRLSTEIQMLLFADTMNQTRETQNQLPLNALWLWGGGNYEDIAHSSVDRCYSDDPFCQGLTSLNQTPMESLSNFSCEPSSDAKILFMDNRGADAIAYGNLLAWKEWITGLETELFTPLWRALKSGQINKITLTVGNGREFSIVGSRFPTFWRRRKSLQSLVNEETVELNAC